MTFARRWEAAVTAHGERPFLIFEGPDQSVAYVVPRDAEHPPAISDLAEWSARNLPAAARPRDWHLIEALPRTSVGKVRRFRL